MLVLLNSVVTLHVGNRRRIGLEAYHMSLSIAVDVVVHIEGNVVEETDLLVVGVDVTNGVTVFVVIVLTVIRVIDDGRSREIFNEPRHR